MIKASVRCERCLDSYVNDVLNYDTLGSTYVMSRVMCDR